MEEQLDLTGLGPDEVRLVKELLEFLKARAAKPEARAQDVEYRTWPLGVKGAITRREIYDYL